MFGKSQGREGPGGRRRGQGGRGGPPAECICPKCRTIVPHRPGVPCFQTRCPACGTAMMGRFADTDE